MMDLDPKPEIRIPLNSQSSNLSSIPEHQIIDSESSVSKSYSQTKSLSQGKSTKKFARTSQYQIENDNSFQSNLKPKPIRTILKANCKRLANP